MRFRRRCGCGHREKVHGSNFSLAQSAATPEANFLQGAVDSQERVNRVCSQIMLVARLVSPLRRKLHGVARVRRSLQECHQRVLDGQLFRDDSLRLSLQCRRFFRLKPQVSEHVAADSGNVHGFGLDAHTPPLRQGIKFCTRRKETGVLPAFLGGVQNNRVQPADTFDDASTGSQD